MDGIVPAKIYELDPSDSREIDRVWLKKILRVFFKKKNLSNSEVYTKNINARWHEVNEDYECFLGAAWLTQKPPGKHAKKKMFKIEQSTKINSHEIP